MINNNYVGVKTLNSLSYLYEKKIISLILGNSVIKPDPATQTGNLIT